MNRITNEDGAMQKKRCSAKKSSENKIYEKTFIHKERTDDEDVRQMKKRGRRRNSKCKILTFYFVKRK